MNEMSADPARQLLDWRREGVWRVDPLRFAHMETLLRRLPGQSAAVQARLAQRLQMLLEDYAQRVQRARQAVAEEVAELAARLPSLARSLRPLLATGDLRGLRRLAARSAPRSAASLSALLAQVQQSSPTVRAADPADVAAGREELASVRAFRRVWGQRESLDRLALARARLPEKPGPLNSHALVLQLLAQVQTLSPDYLRHLLAQVESLQWLEQVQSSPPPVAKPIKAPRRRKA
jgi:hypothetical protein